MTGPQKSVDGVLVELEGDELAAFLSQPPPPPVSAGLIEYAAAKRWQIETGGISIGGLAVHTDDRSKSMLMGARLHVATDPGFTTRWKTPDGTFAVLDAATIMALSSAVLSHVDACFDREADVLEEILAERVTTREQIDAAFADVTAPWIP